MAKLVEADCQPPLLFDNSESNLQPFFVLHRRPKTGRKVDVSPNPVSSSAAQLEGQIVSDFDDDNLNYLRIDAFNSVWSKIDATIKEVLRNINLSVFNDVNFWVYESFKAIRSRGEPSFLEATRSYPIATDALFKQLYVGLVYTRNIEFVDDQLTFEELRLHLKSHGCHVANLSSQDFSAKNGIGSCLTRLMRQFLEATLDVADMSILASWYSGQREYKPVVIIIEDVERCCGSILSDFILMLSEWVVKIPVILVMGVATTLDAPRNVLSSNALGKLCCSKFMLGSPAERMDAIVEAVLLKPSSWFNIGYKVALFMKDYFVKHDGTLMSFTRALKIACMQHFSSEPLSFLLQDLDAEEDIQMWSENDASKWAMVLKNASQLHSCRSVGQSTSENLIKALVELKRQYKCWGTVVMCLYEAVRNRKTQLLDLFCEALDHDPQKRRTYRENNLQSNGRCYDEGADVVKKVFITQAVRNVRDLQPKEMSELLERWKLLSADVSEIHEKVKELQGMMKLVDSKSSGRHSSRSITIPKDPKASNDKAVALVEWMLRDHMKPIEGLPLHEICCFKKVDRLQIALLGDPRKIIQADLLEFHKYLCCSCCSNRENNLLPSFPDTSIMYILIQEHGDVINIHDLYQSFKLSITRPSAKSKSKSKNSSLPKKRKSVDDSHSYSEENVQARFCRAISELQITGLLRMPSKRRPDFLQRVAFGF